MKTKRTLFILTGWVIGYVGNIILPMEYALGTILVGIGLTLWGCYLWTQIKNRHWAFSFWGIISPIGLLGISLLKDNSNGQ